MNGRQLKKLISELVRKEIRQYKEEIINEVRSEIKAELFDLFVGGGMSPGKPVNESVAAPTPPSKPNIDRTSLRELFEKRVTDGEGFHASLANADPAPTPTVVPPQQLPPTFTGRSEEGAAKPTDMERTLGAINRDYSSLLKKIDEKKNR